MTIHRIGGMALPDSSRPMTAPGPLAKPSSLEERFRSKYAQAAQSNPSSAGSPRQYGKEVQQASSRERRQRPAIAADTQVPQRVQRQAATPCGRSTAAAVWARQRRKPSRPGDERVRAAARQRLFAIVAAEREACIASMAAAEDDASVEFVVEREGSGWQVRIASAHCDSAVLCQHEALLRARFDAAGLGEVRISRDAEIS